MSKNRIISNQPNQNTPLINPTTTIKLEQPICFQHHQYFSHLCNHPECQSTTRLCKSCIGNHDSHPKSVRSQEGASKDIKKNLALCLQKIEEADNRYVQITNLMKATKQTLSDNQEKIIKELMKELQKDSQTLSEKMKKLKQLNLYLDQLYRLGKYFKQLKKLNLLELRIQMSSETGLESFKQKNQLFKQFIKKDVFESFKNYKLQYDELVQQFLKVYQNNFTFRLNQIIKMKASKKQMMRRTKDRQTKIQQKENLKIEEIGNEPKKQKEQPKSTSNISQGFFTSILNFFGAKK